MLLCIISPLLHFSSSQHGLHKFDYEESRMIKLLRTEFESDGIHLPDADRSDIVGLKNELVDLESEVRENLEEGRYIIQMSSLRSSVIRPL